jgi:uncharacterized DUF497 family protein
MGKKFRWSKRKNHFLRTERGISFEEIVEAMAQGRLLDVRENKSRNHRGQRIFIVDVHDYPWVVPFDETETEIILKTAFPNRKLKNEFEDDEKAHQRGRKDLR